MEHQEWLEELRRSNELLRRQLNWTRAAAGLLAVLTVVFAVCFVGMSHSVGQISAQMSELDIAAISRQLEDVDLSAVTDQIAKLDMEAVNATIDAFADKLEQMDVQTFNEAVRRLNDAVDALQGASDAVKGWGDRLSQSVSGLFG